MNSLEFFHAHFGRHFGDTPSAVLQGTHPVKGKAPSRLTSGHVAIVKASGSILRGAFDVTGVETTDTPSYELFARYLLNWSGEPFMLLEFEKVLFPVTNLFVSYDKRRVRLCNAKRVTDLNIPQILAAAKRDELNGPAATMFATFKKITKDNPA